MKSRKDSELVAAARGGDSKAFDALIERHYGLAYSIAYARLKSPEASEDLAQEVFLRTYLNLDSLRDNGRYAAWVARLARNLAIDWARRGAVRSRLIALVAAETGPTEDSPMDTKSPRDALEEHEDRAALDEALWRLPEDQRELVLLHYQEGLSKAAISERLGVHKSTVGRQLDRALGAMRGQFEAGLRASFNVSSARRPSIARTSALIAATAGLSLEAKAALASAAAETAAAAAPIHATATASAGGAFAALPSLVASVFKGGAVLGTGKFIAASAVVVVGAGGLYLGTAASNRSTSPGAPAGASAQAAPEDGILSGLPEEMVHRVEISAEKPADYIIPWGNGVSVDFTDHPYLNSMRLLAALNSGLVIEVDGGSEYSGGDMIPLPVDGEAFSQVGTAGMGDIEFIHAARTEEGVRFYRDTWKSEDFAIAFEKHRKAYDTGQTSKRDTAAAIVQEAANHGITPTSADLVDEFRKEFGIRIVEELQWRREVREED